MRNIESFKNPDSCQLLICDEAHKLKNYKTKNYNVLFINYLYLNK